jgi:hypothetical protein
MEQSLFHAMFFIADQKSQWDFRSITGLFDEIEVRMRASLDLHTGRAVAAGIEVGFGMVLAKQGLGEFPRESSLSYAWRPGEQETARQPPPRDGPAKLLDDLVLTENAVPGSGG